MNFALADFGDYADYFLRITKIKKAHQIDEPFFTISKWSVPAIEDQKQSAFCLRQYCNTARSF